MAGRPPRFITPEGFARIRAEYEQLFGSERPKLVDTIAWAAGNGDRSENGDISTAANAFARSTAACPIFPR